MAAATPSKRLQEVSFTVQTVDCITCSPFFRRPLGKIDGVVEVKELPVTNKIVVVFDATRLDRRSLLEEITKISQKVGLGGKILVHR